MRRQIIQVAAALCAIFVIAQACTHSPYVLPESKRGPADGICFETDVLPVFQSNCAKGGCHDAASHEEGYTLTSYSTIVNKGIVPGNPAASRIYEVITIAKGEKFMPQGSPALTAQQVSIIKQWITAGAVQGGYCSGPCDSVTVTYNATIAPIITTYCLGCHNSPSEPGGSLASYTAVKDATLSGRLMGDIMHSAGYNQMPRGGAQLDACKLAQFRRWVAIGAPEN